MMWNCQFWRMQKTVRFLFFCALVFGIKGAAWAAPTNDSTCNAIDLGVMPAPGICPTFPDGAYINFSGATDFATFNPIDFSVTHCFPNPSPDVWYKFQATGSFLYIDVLGLSGLNNFFVKLHHSQGSCLSLVPLECIASTGNTLTYSFPTPVVNGEYYLQIGGSAQTVTGNFVVNMKSYNDCNGCVKRGNVTLHPAPVYGRYNSGDTVEMCVTVSRWESLATSYLHTIVPQFGPDWDTLSIVPTLIPTSVSAPIGWYWMNNIWTPNGTHSGFAFDPDGDGNPSDNAGDNGNILSSWTGCWKIKAVIPCLTTDLSMDVHLYSDGETGAGNPLFVCNPYDAIHVSTSSICCPPPVVNVSQLLGCTFGSASVDISGQPIFANDTFNYYLVDTSMTAVQWAMGIVGPYTFGGLFPGQYFVIADNVSNGSCVGFQSFTINPPLVINVQQTSIGCVSGQGQAVVNIVNPGNNPYSYNWINVLPVNQNDSVAMNLPDGWVSVVVTNMSSGCSAIDSIFIISEGIPDPTFNLVDSPTCANADTILLAGWPNSPGGTFTLLSPTTGGITVDSAWGTIYLNNTTLAPPFYIYVQYTVGTNCQASYIDSALIVAVPQPPTAISPLLQDYCIGGTAPFLTAIPPIGMYTLWFDAQTSGYTLGDNYQTPLNGSTPQGLYYYVAVTVFTLTGGCTSSPVIFTVNAVPSPQIISSNDTSICPGELADVAVFGCSTCNYFWSPIPTSGSQFSSSFQTSPATSTNYSVVVTDPGTGCSSFENCFVGINNCDSTTFVIYHGITPNGDGHNDTWIIDGLDSLSDVNVSIYNRWGDRVWIAYNYDNVKAVWKGQDNRGNALPDGTYFYLISYKDKRESGWIELSH